MSTNYSWNQIDLNKFDKITQQEINSLVDTYYKIYGDIKTKLRCCNSIDEQKEFFKKELEALEDEIHYVSISGVYDAELEKEKLRLR